MIFTVSLAFNFAAAYKLVLREKKQVNTLLVNSGTLTEENCKRFELNNCENLKVHSQKSGELNVLFIGNSLTLHPFADYWWTLCGMAASEEYKDYVHQTCALLIHKCVNQDGKKITKVNFVCCNFASWEVMSHDRAETLSLIEQFLSNRLDYVYIQLGENVSDTKTLKSDFDTLLEYINSRTAPESEEVMLGTFFKKDSVENIKNTVCSERKIRYVNLVDMQNDQRWTAPVGTKVYDKQGNEHSIEHSGVSLHPGDAGMAEIALRIVKTIGCFNSARAGELSVVGN